MANKAVPTALRKLRGNPGRRPLNRMEPKPARGAAFPVWLDGLGDPAIRQIWDELAGLLDRSKLLTEADGEALAMLTHKIALYRTAALALKDGCSYSTITETGAEMFRQKPEYTIVSDLGKQIRGLLSDFGMNPSSRCKVSVATGRTQDAGPGAAWPELSDFLSGRTETLES